MIVQTACPACGAVARIEEESFGRRARCKKCSHVFRLTRSSDSLSSVPSATPSAMDRVASVSSPSSPPGPTNLPEQFGRYRIMRLLGQGGMGAVHLAHDTKLDRPVALKVPFFSSTDGPEAIARFEREARVAATLDHPNLCPVYDVGQVDGIHYLTMPYIEGHTLASVISEDQVRSIPDAVTVVCKLALAVQVAHDKGIIHRDLKPGNILVSKHRDLVVMDFGLAHRDASEDSPLTRTGMALGTALYMAPEQAVGELSLIGPRCDVYSLGIILYEMLTGVRPFEGPWSIVIGLKSVMDPDSPSKHRPDLGPALDAICLKAIARKPEDRYALMTEFASALNASLIAPAAAPPIAIPEDSPAKESSPSATDKGLANQFLAGLVTFEPSSIQDKPRSDRGTGVNAGVPRGARPKRKWILVAGGVGLLMLGLAAAWMGGVLEAKTPEGTIVIENLPAGARVMLDGRELEIKPSHDDEPFAIAALPGRHRILATKGRDRFESEFFEIVAGGRRGVRLARTPTQPENPSSVLVTAGPNEKAQNADVRDKPTPTQKGRDRRDLLAEASTPKEAPPSGTAEASKPSKPKGVEPYSKSATYSDRIEAALAAYLAKDINLALSILDGIGPQDRGWEWHHIRRMCAEVGPALLSFQHRQRPDGINSNKQLLPGVWGLAFSPDSRFLATNGGTMVNLWDLRRGRRAKELREHEDSAFNVAFSLDGGAVVGGSEDGVAKVWNSTSGQLVGMLRGHNGPVYGVVYALGGSVIVTSGRDGALRTWNASSGQAIDIIRGHEKGYIQCLAVNRDGDMVISGGLHDNTVQVWNLRGGKVAAVLCPDRVHDVAFSPDSQMFAAGLENGEVKVYGMADGREALTIKAHRGRVWGIAVSPDGGRIATCGADDPDVILWNSRTGQKTFSLKRPSGSTDVAFSPDGQMLAATGWDGSIQVWLASNPRPLAAAPRMTASGSTAQVRLHPDQRPLGSTKSDDPPSDPPDLRAMLTSHVWRHESTPGRPEVWIRFSENGQITAARETRRDWERATWELDGTKLSMSWTFGGKTWAEVCFLAKDGTSYAGERPGTNVKFRGRAVKD